MNVAARVLPEPVPVPNFDRSLMEDGYVEFETSEVAADFSLIKDGMRYITNDPRFLAALPWRIHEADAYGPAYEQETGLRAPEPHKQDYKYVLQFTPDMVMDRSVLSEPIVRSLFAALGRIDEHAREAALHVAVALDRRRRFPHSIATALESGRVITRVLRYLPKRDETPDAKVHIDRSFLTVHYWSSHPGLRIFDPRGGIVPVRETSSRDIVVFPGRKFAALSRGTLGYGTPHGVRDERRKNGSHGGEDRYAIVSFVHPKSTVEDAAWLHAHRDEIARFEAGFAL